MDFRSYYIFQQNPSENKQVFSMLHDERNYLTKDNLSIYFQVWKPDISPRGVIQVVHGFAEHSNRYQNVINHLVPSGYIIYIADLRGHGQSEGIRSYVKTFDDYIDDQYLLTEIIKEEYPNIPLFLLGHSLGCSISTFLILKYADKFNGLILSGTGTREGGGAPGFLKKLSGVLARLFPKFKIKAGLDPKVLSRDHTVVKEYSEDPKIFSYVTMSLGHQILSKTSEAYLKSPAIKLPTLVISGAEDKLMLDVKEVFENIGSPDKTLKLYEGCYHEMFNELNPERTQALNDLLAWLNKRT